MNFIYLILIAFSSSRECSDKNCLDCEFFSDGEFCRLCSDGLFPSFNQCLTCESQPLNCHIFSSKWSCFCSSTLSYGFIELNPTLTTHCIEGQSCQICLEGYIFSENRCLKIEEDLYKNHNKRYLTPSNCLEVLANDPNQCRVCEEGYFVFTGNCAPCFMNCKGCSTHYECTSCIAPLVLETNKKACCVAGCTNCHFGTCLACGTGYTYNNYNCESLPSTPTIPCPTNCNTCDNSGSCMLCNWGYSKSTTSNECNKCENGYYPITGGCAQCFSRCQTCDLLENCNTCVSGFTLIGAFCCPPGCSSCTHEKCLGCTSEYSYDGTNCKLSCPTTCNKCLNNVCLYSTDCPSNCELCTSKTSCYKCKEGFYPGSNGCNKCFYKCLTCQLYDVCTSCVAGHTKIGGFCCPPGCNSCNHEKCLGCSTGYNYDGTNCGNCPSNCNGCPKGVCETSTGCSKNCELCNTQNSCNKCVDGYFIESGSCIKCFDRCSTCDYYETCKECVNGYNKIDKYCCPVGCSSCNNNKCLSCSSGFLYDGTSCNACPANCNGCLNGVCNYSNNCPKNCELCTCPTSCSICVAGYYPISGKCGKCPKKCSTCTLYEICTGCSAPELTLINGFCCPPGCTSCNHYKCFGCSSGYKYDGINCSVICSTNCQTCESLKACTECKFGFYLSSSGDCNKCSSTCATCSADNCCLTCMPGYDKVGDNCCPKNCFYCSSTGCIACIEGYGLIEGNCFKCPDNCLTCTSQTICSLCKDGFYKKSGKCIQCNSKCKTCSDASKCISCHQGYEIAGPTSTKCCLVGCSDCNTNNDHCTYCKYGYAYNASTKTCKLK